MLCSRMEPHGASDRDGLSREAETKQEQVSQNFRSLNATLPKKFFAALVECVAATILHALEQRLH